MFCQHRANITTQYYAEMLQRRAGRGKRVLAPSLEGGLSSRKDDRGVDLDLKSEGRETLDEAFRHPVTVEPVQVRWTEILVGDAVSQDVVGGGEDRGRNRDDGLHRS